MEFNNVHRTFKEMLYTVQWMKSNVSMISGVI